MKIIRSLVLAAALLGATTVSQPAFARSAHKAASKVAAKTTTFAVSKMDCAGCAGGLGQSLQKAKGVQSARVDFKTKRATVAYDAGQTSDAKLLAVFKAAGFPARVVR